MRIDQNRPVADRDTASPSGARTGSCKARLAAPVVTAKPAGGAIATRCSLLCISVSAAGAIGRRRRVRLSVTDCARTGLAGSVKLADNTMGFTELIN